MPLERQLARRNLDKPRGVRDRPNTRLASRNANGSDAAIDRAADKDGNTDNISQPGSAATDKAITDTAELPPDESTGTTSEKSPPNGSDDATDPAADKDGTLDNNSQPGSAATDKSITDTAEGPKPPDESTGTTSEKSPPNGSEDATDPAADKDGTSDNNSQPGSADSDKAITDTAEGPTPPDESTGTTHEKSPPNGSDDATDPVADKDGNSDNNSQPGSAAANSQHHSDGDSASTGDAESSASQQGSAVRENDDSDKEHDSDDGDTVSVADDDPRDISPLTDVLHHKMVEFRTDMGAFYKNPENTDAMFQQPLRDVVHPPFDTVGLCFLGKQTIPQTDIPLFMLVHHSMQASTGKSKSKKKFQMSKEQKFLRRSVTDFFLESFDDDSNEGYIRECLSKPHEHLLLLCARKEHNLLDFPDGLVAVVAYRCFRNKCVAIDFVRVTDKDYPHCGSVAHRGVCPFMLGLVQVICRPLTNSWNTVLYCQMNLRRYYVGALLFRDITQEFSVKDRRPWRNVSNHWNWDKLRERYPDENVVLQKISFIRTRSNRINLQLPHSSAIFKKQQSKVLADDDLWSPSTKPPDWMTEAMSAAYDYYYKESQPKVAESDMIAFKPGRIDLEGNKLPWIDLGHHIKSSYDRFPPRSYPYKTFFEVTSLQKLLVRFRVYTDHSEDLPVYPVNIEERLTNHRNRTSEYQMRVQVKPDYRPGDSSLELDEKTFLLNPAYYRRERSDSDFDLSTDRNLKSEVPSPTSKVEVHVGCSWCKKQIVLVAQDPNQTCRLLFEFITNFFFNHVTNTVGPDLSIPVETVDLSVFDCGCRIPNPKVYESYVSAARHDKHLFLELKEKDIPLEYFFDFALYHIANWCKVAIDLHWYKLCRLFRKRRYEEAAYSAWAAQSDNVREGQLRRSTRPTSTAHFEQEQRLMLQITGKTNAKQLEGLYSSQKKPRRKSTDTTTSMTPEEAELENRKEAKKKYDDAVCLKRVQYWEWVVPRKRSRKHPKLPPDSRRQCGSKNHLFGWFNDNKHGRAFARVFFDQNPVPENKKAIDALVKNKAMVNKRQRLTKRQHDKLEDYADRLIKQDQIYKLRALTAEEIREHPRADDNDEDTHRPPHFLGIVSETETKKYLSMEWARWNFQPRFPNLFRELQSLGSSKFKRLPDGCLLDTSGIELPADGPTVSYLQGTTDACVFCSVASALDYIGDHRMRDYIADHIELSVSQGTVEEDRVKFAVNLLTGKLQLEFPPKMPLKFYQQKGKRLMGESKKKTFQITNCVNHDLTICSFKNQHTVSIVNGLIFDSNHSHALPVNDLACINWCLGNETYEVVNLPYDLSTQVRLVYRFEVPYVARKQREKRLKRKRLEYSRKMKFYI